MRIVVLIKQVPDVNAVKIDRGSGKPVLSGQQAISSFDDYAIEEAIRLKEAHGGEITILCAGPAGAKDALMRALAMGADQGVHLLLDDPNALDTLALAGVLADRLRAMTFGLLLCGQNSDDTATGHVGPQVAELLGLPHVSSVTKVEIGGGVGSLTLQRDTEDGRQVVEVTPPVVLLAMTGLNTPRYPSLKGIMAAKRKPIEQVRVTAPPPAGRLSWSEPRAPERTATGIILQDVPPAEAARRLVAWLREQKLA